MTKPPRFIGVFPSQFPGWTVGPRHGPYYMFTGGDGIDYSDRFIPVGVSAIDADGRCWILVHDHAIAGPWNERLRWTVFDAPVAE